MRILQLHCDSIDYEPVRREIKSAEPVEDAAPRHLEEVVVAFVAVEDGDDSSVARDAASQVLSSMEKIGCSRLLLYPYAHLSSRLAPPDAALSVLREMESAASGAAGPGFEVSRSPFGWTKSYQVRVKGHPLAESSKTVVRAGLRGCGAAPAGAPPGAGGGDAPASEALEGEAGIKSHWNILSPDGTMTPVADFDFGGHPKLGSLSRYESSKRRGADEPPPHVGLMKRMGIADYEPASDSGNMRFYPNGRLIKSLIERYVTDRVKEYGGCEVETPIMYDSHHHSMRSYFNRFPARQYSIDSEGKSLFLRFAACFGQFLMANDLQLSYRSLPCRLYELTRYSFRREQSGELVGLHRLRAFTMPDCHSFCRDMGQAAAELEARFDLSADVIRELGIGGGDYEMAIRFTEDFYNENRELVMGMVRRHGKPVLTEMWREKFFYFVLKWEFNYVDAAGKASALSTDQIDVENAERYGIEFADEDGAMRNPLILHNSPCGAVERVIYALLENAARDAALGKKPQLPLWLAPTQVRIIPLKEEFAEFAGGLAEEISSHSVRVDVDDRNESVGRRIRDAEKEWIRYTLVVGGREAGSGELSVRDRGTGSVRQLSAGDLAAEIGAETAGKPFSALNLPRYLSRRPQVMV